MVDESVVACSREARFLFAMGEGMSAFPACGDALGETPFFPTDEGLREIMREASELLSLRAKWKGISYGIEIAPGLARRVVVDRRLLLWSLACLSINGVQHTERGEVVLGVSPGMRSGWLRFHVRDSGAGLSPGGMEALFRMAGDDRMARTHERAGRLALCKRLVERMGGFIRGESRLGVGSTFTAEIPADGVSFENNAL